MSDIEIAQACKLTPIAEIAAKLGIAADDLEPYGKYKAKLAQSFINSLADNNQAHGKLIAKLILVTAISPTPAGEGKTTTTIGLADALSALGQKTAVCIREPSLGPVFGMKGGATGGGYSQVAPMEDINLHFTGDFHAIGAANNLLAALIDNHIYHGNALQIDPEQITWRRCLDMNDRALRHITTYDGDQKHETGFDIVVATEVMAVFCLATSLTDLQQRLGQMQVAYSQQNTPIFASDLKAEGAMTALLKEAFAPNLVQTLEHTPVIVHGGPFANIAHGCNSVIATKTALKLADYVVTEAGFGADLGAEKFIDIKCRQSGLKPDLAVLVATVRAVKYHGGVDLPNLNSENLEALKLGVCNLQRHINNLKQHFGLEVIVAINHFATDTEAELNLLQVEAEKLGAKAILCKHWALGAKGAKDLAQQILETLEPIETESIKKEISKKTFKFLYETNLPILKKIECIAKKIYGAGEVLLSLSAVKTLKTLESEYQNFPVCIAKTQYSLSSIPGLRGAPTGHTLQVRELRLLRGAGFIVAICGDVMTMPGLPKTPASERIGVDATGKITGLA
ncbi:MAG: formate--tetrahydrofolate ligase [Methylophilaceae bacterium]|nr:formate--tetrahydrofolate ligase [Methylophilaceae bacterium]